MENTKQRCSIAISADSLLAEQVLINFNIKNPFNRNMKLLMWYTPLEGFLSDLFIVTNSDTGEQLDYQGPMIKRLKPQAEDYLSISPNEVSSATVNLSLAYVFSKGNYHVKLKKNTFHFLDDNLNRFPFVCEVSTISISIQ